MKKLNQEEFEKRCKEHNIKLLYYTEDNYEEFLGKNTDDLLKEIRSTS